MKRGREDHPLILSTGICLALAGAILAAALTLPGRAQSMAPEEPVPQIVIDGLARAGLSTPTNVRQRGPNYTANALTRTGAPVKVVIQGSNGAIIGYRVLTPVDVRP